MTYPFYMKKFYLIFLFSLSLTSNAQWIWNEFSGEEKAFFFQICRRTEILKPELFHLFEFTDSIPYINDTLPDYTYVEKQIVKSPEKLILHVDQVQRKSSGLWSELAMAYGLWELDRVLHYRASTDKIHEDLKPKLKEFELYVMENIPQSALTELSSGKYTIMKGITNYFTPSMSVKDKMAALANSGYSEQDQMLILNAIYEAQEKYATQVAALAMKYLGFIKDEEGAQDFLSAAGDGSSFSELQGFFKTPYNNLVPDERGLFQFEAEIYQEKEEKPDGEVILKKPIVRIKDIVTREFRTHNQKSTKIHFNVLGFHPERQTTIAIQKGGTSYILYGKNEHRLISPDSTYGKGTTYWRLLYELENYYIADLNEKLYGKRGYEFWIETYEGKIRKTELLIKKTEYKLDQLRHQPMGQPKMKKKKIKKKDLGKSDQINGHPTNTVTKNEKKINIEQNRLVHLNTQWENEKNTLAKLKKEMEEAYFLLVKYQTLYDKMLKNLGYVFMDYKQVGNLYVFNDGAIFNYVTQDFIFPTTGREEVFQVFHISFGEKVLSTSIDESFVHMHFSYYYPQNTFMHERILADKNSTVGITKSDSIQFMEIFETMAKGNLKAQLTVVGGGIAGENELGYFRDSNLVAEPYNEAAFQSSGKTILRAEASDKLYLTVTAWGEKTIPFAFQNYQAAFSKFKSKNPDLNEVDFYTGIKAKHHAEKWLASLKQLANVWIKEPAKKAKILKTLNAIKVKEVWFKNRQIKASVPDMTE